MTAHKAAPASAWDSVSAEWYKLDHAAILFPTVAGKGFSTLYRLQANLRKPVNAEALQAALDAVAPRFPYYLVEVRPGLFWYYFNMIENKTPQVMADSRYPCQNLRIGKGVYLFRVRAYACRIAIEFSHILTDGGGSFSFFKTLLAEYFRITEGVEITDEERAAHDIKRIPREAGEDYVSLVDPAEFEDAFKVNYAGKRPFPAYLRKAWHLPGPVTPRGVYRVIIARVPLAQILAKAKEYKVSLTEFLAAVHLEALQDILERKGPRRGGILRLMIPVNLRKLWPSRTMRNFSLYTLPGIDTRLGHWKFEEILEQVYHHMRSQANAKVIAQQISRNVGSAASPFAKHIPLFVKKLMGKFLYRKYGENLYSGCITNMGTATMPGALAQRVENFEFMPTSVPITKANLAVVSWDDSLYITFGSLVAEPELERLMLTRLVKFGIKVRIETN